MRIEDGQEKQYHEATIDDVGKRVVEAVIKHENDKAQHQRRAYPHDLHARARAQAEDVGLAIGVARTADTDPAEEQQRHVDANRPPVETLEYSGLFICFLSHKQFCVSATHQPRGRGPERVCH